MPTTYDFNQQSPDLDMSSSLQLSSMESVGLAMSQLRSYTSKKASLMTATKIWLEQTTLFTCSILAL